MLEAWKEFVNGKRKKKDVQEFSFRLMDRILSLHDNLRNHRYIHGGYRAFAICDPKPRNIHKAIVRDRLLHHAIHRKLYPFFDRIFIADSYSCRIGKGTHRAINRFRSFSRKAGKNNTKTCWVLKCDIKKFFANIDHGILKKILANYIPDKDILWLLSRVIDSFEVGSGIGLPLGNLTSQLFANIYMNEFDRFMKHKLKVRYYIRYADDFVIFSEDRAWLESRRSLIGEFLQNRLRLELHPNKVFIKTLASGVDFLGWVHFPDHRVLRTTTKRRMMKRIAAHPTEGTFNSYRGLLGHGNTYKFKKLIG
ncbi:MAG: group II intron reverse transcriptase domain-containing protein [Patescibacteria group bacterium]|nr:group II intron reverse transcriptase domain-containing protein [Patescibacteria group bacterium]